MSYSYTSSATESFTLTHAKYIASKVATDLLRFTRFYRRPTIEEIDKYEAELTAFLNAGYLESVTYGFQRNGKWVEALRYHALADGSLMGDDDPGKVRPGTDVPEEHFTSYLIKNARWNSLTPAQQAAFDANLPFQRVGVPEPQLESGQWSQGHTYSAGGRGIGRSTIIR